MPYFSTFTQFSLKRLQRFELLTFQRSHLEFDNGFRFYSRQSHSFPFFSKCFLVSLEKQLFCVKRVIAIHTNKCGSFYSTGFGRFGAKDDHYSVLGVKEDASSSEIRAAFLKKSKECHPDLNPTDPNSQKKFVRVNEAYSVLSQSSSKRDYDRSKNNPQQHSSGPYGRPQYKYRSSKPKPDYQPPPPHNFYRKEYREEYYESKETKRRRNVLVTIGIIIFVVYLVFSNLRKDVGFTSESASASSAKPTGSDHFPKKPKDKVVKKPKDKAVKEEEIRSLVKVHPNDESNTKNGYKVVKEEEKDVFPRESAMKISASSAKPTDPEHFPKNFRFIKKNKTDKFVKEKEIISLVMDHTNDEINKKNGYKVVKEEENDIYEE